MWSVSMACRTDGEGVYFHNTEYYKNVDICILLTMVVGARTSGCRCDSAAANGRESVSRPPFRGGGEEEAESERIRFRRRPGARSVHRHLSRPNRATASGRGVG